ncbi:MAG TPA: hypothetical protein PLM37_11460, partial [Elusimicrobiota bacterium]|nr:hypothetical protein [Elusimicrobiota bacterium]
GIGQGLHQADHLKSAARLHAAGGRPISLLTVDETPEAREGALGEFVIATPSHFHLTVPVRPSIGVGQRVSKFNFNPA